MNLQGIFPTPHDFKIERVQAVEEGRDLGELALLLDEASQLESIDWEDAIRLFESVQAAPYLQGRGDDEPSDLPSIRALRPTAPPLPDTDAGRYRERLEGAWLGRIAGCLLGKPVEGWTRRQILEYGKQVGQTPLRSYLRRSEDALRSVGKEKGWCFLGEFDSMPEDDDINYTVSALAILQDKGTGFTTEDVASFWLANIPILSTFTAERAAYRNLILGHYPPASATFANPYREWIGAQIRADLFGYVRPGDPESAAELAFRDAAVSHVKNGIYGEMWSAACNAAAFAVDHPREALLGGIAQVPEGCRLSLALREVLGWHEAGDSLDLAVHRVHEKWDETFSHGWCHTVSNAMIVAIALLWGEMDYAATVGIAVEAGFDTDCNAATAGSILGAILGPSALPQHFVRPLNGRVQTGVRGYSRVDILELVDATARLARV